LISLLAVDSLQLNWFTGSGEVSCEYSLKEPGPGGFAEVRITMESEKLPGRNIFLITVKFPTKRQQAMLYGAENLVC
jgi:hypothetical protein